MVDGEEPKKLKWVTGPPGSGKSAIMGSLADRCEADGILGATFFFSSWAPSNLQRRKTAVVPTIAHQLARYHPGLRVEISKSLEANPDVFFKHLQEQMEVLILAPVRRIADRPGDSSLRGVIIIDGLDECEAEQPHKPTTPSTQENLRRKSAEDQKEILDVLLQAASDRSFPFRILIASRSEPVFRNFFNPERDPTSFSPTVNLHEDYNPDDDMIIFLEAHFSQIRRRCDLPPSWPPLGTVQILVINASGQFIYVATVIRFLEESPQAPPNSQLESVLGIRVEGAWSPLERLDALYLHIFDSGSDPSRSALWIRAINQLHMSGKGELALEAVHLNLLFEKENGEAERLLGSLHSLVRIPPPSKQATTTYGFYHKSLLEFIEDPARCGRLNVEKRDINIFLWDRFVRSCTSEFISFHLFSSLA